MKEWLLELCGANFMPHGQCYLWTPSLVWLHAVSDALIALAYFSIPLALVYFVRKRRDLPFPMLFLMFGAFIVACGSTHVLEVWTIWNGAYYLTGSVKAFTAAISLTTAAMLFRAMPDALQLRGPEELRRLNESLEERVRARTAELERGNVRLREEAEQRRQAEAEITRLNRLLRSRVDELESLLKVLPVGVAIARDASCRDIRINDVLAALLGVEPGTDGSLPAGDSPLAERLVVRRGEKILAAEDMPIQRCVAENQVALAQELEIEHEGGRRLELLCNAAPLRDASGAATGCVATFQDVSELKSALRANERYAAIVASSEDAVVGSTLEGVVTDWNRGAERIFGYAADEIVGQPVKRLLPPDRMDEDERRLALLTSGASPTPYETQRLRKDGSLVEVSVMISPIRDAAGRLVGYSKFARDITKRRREERRRLELERKIQETQKLESLGVLAGGIAHDFNNLLTVILGNAALAANSVPASSGATSYLQHIEKAACSAARLCSQMLAYARQERFEARPLDVNRLIEESSQLISVSVGKNALLRFHLAPDLPSVNADAAQIRQLVMNLVINASEALGDRAGVIALTTGFARVDADDLAALRHAEEMRVGDHVFLEVSDTGQGMDAATLRRVFEPFFTTKFIGRGLGLAAVLGIVRGHKGGLTVYSEPGRGTTFKLFLPAMPGAEREVSTPAPAPAFRATGRVLVIDDDATARAVASRLLERVGFEVELAADGREGLARFAEDPESYALVLLDLTMPHPDGEETFRRLRHTRPGVRVVLMSGFNEQEATAAFAGKGLAGFVQKPLNTERALAVIRSLFPA